MPENKALEAFTEIETMQKLDNPFVVGYIDSFTEGMNINIVMEFCTGGDLCHAINKHKLQCNKFKPF